MKKYFKNFNINIKLAYVFLLLDVILMISMMITYNKYVEVEKKIIDFTFSNDINYVESVSSNIVKLIKHRVKGDIYTSLKDDRNKIRELESYLQLFITKRYKYIYVVQKIKDRKGIYRFLLDGSVKKEDRSDFGDIYEPFEESEWNRVYKTKKSIYFSHKELKTLWVTYLKPIVVDDKIDAILVFDFSMQGHYFMVNILKELENNYKKVIILFMTIFLFIILFSYIDFKREKEKDEALARVEQINKTLTQKIEKAVEENRQKDLAMFQQSRLAQMGEMLGMIAHQWRQPLSAISSTSAAINLKAKLGKLNKENAIFLSDKISTYSLHLSSTIDDFRNFFKIKKEKSDINFPVLIESVLSIVEMSISNKNIAIQKELKTKENIKGYPNELKQVLLNLVKNSEDILIEKEIENPYIKIRTYKNGDRVILEVSDNGGGIEESIIDKIFDPYFSTKTKKDGTGLGLYMSKIIVEEHCGGKLSVINGSDGAIFRVEFGGNDV